MKKIIKYIVKAPLSFFWYCKNRYFYNKAILNGTYSPFINSIVEDGYCIIGKSFGNINFSEILSEINSIKSKNELIKSGQEKGRIINPHQMSNVIASYTNFLQSIAAEYFGDRNIQIEMSLFQRSEPETQLSEIPGGEGFHIDDGKKTLKFFLYLTDVSEKNGPFCYVPSSHGLRGWLKFKRIIQWNIFNEHFTLYFDDSLVNVNESVLVCLDKGNLFCADTTGFHKATPVLEGEREILVVSFNEKRLDLV